jgi:hypothetical protein
MISEIKVNGLSELATFLQQLPEKMAAGVLRGAVRAGAKPIAEEAQRRVAHKSGELARGIKIATKKDGTKIIARVVITGKHAFVAYWLEYTGAAPHEIKARKAKTLFFDGDFREEVHHPGFHPEPFFRVALETRADEAISAAAEYVKSKLATKYGLDTSDIEVDIQ